MVQIDLSDCELCFNASAPIVHKPTAIDRAIDGGLLIYLQSFCGQHA